MPKSSQQNSQPAEADLAELKNEIQAIKKLLLDKFSDGNLRVDQQSPSEIRQLLEENLKISRELQKLVKKIKSWVNWQTVWGGFKVLIIVIPLILGILYLPALIEQVIEPYKELLNPSSTTQQNNLDVKNLLNQFLNNSNDSGTNKAQ